MATVSSDAVAAYWPLFESRARKHTGLFGAEFDDLVQEGAIAGWQALESGFAPSRLVVDQACRRYIYALVRMTRAEVRG